MKKRTATVLMAMGGALWMGCERAADNSTKVPMLPPVAQPAPAEPQRPKNAVKGDFDGDGRSEYVWLVPPAGLNPEEMACQGECTSHLRFSNEHLALIAVPNCIGGNPTNLGDLNGDGGDEIGLLPEWFSSCWSAYHVFTYRQAAWAPLVKPFATHCNQWEAGVKPIEKDSLRTGRVLIRYSESTDTAIVVRTKSVPVQ